MALRRRGTQQGQQFFFGKLVEVFNMSQTIPAFFQRTYGFLEGFFIIFADAHDFAYCPHLGSQLVIHTLEFFKSPPGEFHYNIISVRYIFIQRTVLAAGQVFQGQAAGQLGRYQGNREARSLGRQSRRPGSTGIDLNNDNPSVLGVPGKLHVGSTDDADMFYDFISLTLQLLLYILRDGKHGCGAEGIAGVHPYRIHVFNEADRDHIVILVADNFQL